MLLGCKNCEKKKIVISCWVKVPTQDVSVFGYWNKFLPPAFYLLLPIHGPPRHLPQFEPMSLVHTTQCLLPPTFTHMSSKTIPPSPKIPAEDYFSSYPPPHLCVSCTHTLVSPAHSCVNVRVHVFQIMSLIQPLMLSHSIAGSYASCNFPFSPSDTGVGTYKPARSCPPASLGHVKPF